jgi:uncharacterized protein (TIGR02145 family)
MRYFSIILFVTFSMSCGTNKTIQHGGTKSAKPTDSILIDRDGNKYSSKQMADGKLWMTSDLKLNLPHSYCYGNDARNCQRYGRLYLWEEAMSGCSLLGDGWRLPSNNDWYQLSKAYAGANDDSVMIRKAAFKSLLTTGNSGFNAVLGGGRSLDSTFGRVDAHGFYWTSTEGGTGMAWFANFAKGSQALYIQSDGEKERAFAVRCVKALNK